MTTFSQLIDDTILELVRPDLDSVFASYLNQTVRELHMFSRDGTPVFYDDNLLEELVTLANVPEDRMYNWAIPNMSLFQGIGAVYYNSISRYVEQRSPKIALRSTGSFFDTYYYYRSGPSIILSNPGADGQQVRMAWYEYPRSLVWYPNGTSPILFDRAAGIYTENPKYTGPALTFEQKMERSTNWMIMRHEEMIREGLRAKAYKRIDDNNRAKLAYSTFETQKLGVQESAQAIYVARYGS